MHEVMTELAPVKVGRKNEKVKCFSGKLSKCTSLNI